MSTYQQLEEKIKELQEEHQKKVNELQAEVDRLKEQEKEDKLPENFERNYILKFLTNLDCSDLRCGFTWRDTPQGYDYWNKIYYSLSLNKSQYKVPDGAIIQLQRWVILSYQQEFGY